MLDVTAILAGLAQRRPVFHSEADFQHALAWQLQTLLPDCAIRLEVPFDGAARGATDIVVRYKGCVHGIELKYLCRKFSWHSGGERFSLKAQGATDLRRYDVLKDIVRLERFNEREGGPSYLIVLTNDPSYWTDRGSCNTIDAHFGLHEGRIVEGRLAWAEHAGAGSIRGREDPILLDRSYAFLWSDYSNVGLNAGHFRFLSVKID